MAEPERALPAKLNVTCRHCGAHDRLRDKGDIIVKDEVEGAWHEGGIRYTTYVHVFVCDACEEPTIWRYIWSPDLYAGSEEQRVYPTSRDNSSLPATVRQRLESAAKVRRIEPGFYAVGMRRMLEAVCNEEGASGKDLFAKLHDLAEKGRIPEPLAEVANQLRELGNLGAHDNTVDVAAEDVPVIEDLSDAILEYLYRAPAKLAAVQESLAERKKQ